MSTISREAILNILPLCEGHAILKPERLIEAGFPPSWVGVKTVRHGSGGEILFDAEGKAVSSVVGVYDLDLVHALCQELGLDAGTPYLGRGKECRCLVQRIREHLDDAARRSEEQGAVGEGEQP